MRRLKPDPVPNELIRKILKAGVCAPSGGNMQRWRFLVIRDPKVKETVGALYKRAWDEQVAPRYRSGEPAPGMSRERFLRLLDAAEYLAAHIHEAPVWIVPCLEGGTPTRTSGSSMYPAVQNMLLTARALGLGATLTTLYLQFEKEAEAALGLPPDVHSYALLPIGYPMGRFGPVRRVALADVVYEDRWASLTGMCSDPEHSASLPKRLAAHLPASVIVVCRTGRRFGHHRHTDAILKQMQPGRHLFTGSVTVMRQWSTKSEFCVATGNMSRRNKKSALFQSSREFA
jgi:nitroreductase